MLCYTDSTLCDVQIKSISVVITLDLNKTIYVLYFSYH